MTMTKRVYLPLEPEWKGQSATKSCRPLYRWPLKRRRLMSTQKKWRCIFAVPVTLTSYTQAGSSQSACASTSLHAHAGLVSRHTDKGQYACMQACMHACIHAHICCQACMCNKLMTCACTKGVKGAVNTDQSYMRRYQG